ncbi:MAG: HypC/HybG/HupF family hydrogenase formation chaperone [Thermodesulfovibrionales bacterium]|nr:HypC/HybG/HupF family hydrogenase formation chaperone [Thermodesulfovibrionales bacterium]
MCLAVPSKIIHKEDLIATVDSQGTRLKVSLLLLPEEVEVGDYVLVHAGFAIQKVQKEAAEDSLRLIEEIKQRLSEETLE